MSIPIPCSGMRYRGWTKISVPLYYLPRPFCFGFPSDYLFLLWCTKFLQKSSNVRALEHNCENGNRPTRKPEQTATASSRRPSAPNYFIWKCRNFGAHLFFMLGYRMILRKKRGHFFLFYEADSPSATTECPLRLPMRGKPPGKNILSNPNRRRFEKG